jgi:hypothetical protein
MQAWFDPITAGRFGGVIGAAVGMCGAVIGIMSGICVPKGWKKTVYTVWAVILALCAGLMVTGLAALAVGQPYHVWYVFILPGLGGFALFGGLLFVVRKRFRDIEMRQMQAKDL